MGQVLSLLQRLVLRQPVRAQASAPKSGKSRRRRRNRRGGANSMAGDGVITLSRQECVASLKVTKGKGEEGGSVDIKPAAFSFLKGVAKSFDRLKWNNLRFYYKPAVGTTFGGLVSFGVDWDWTNTDIARTGISALTPSSTTAAWADTEKTPLILPTSKLQSRTWYSPVSANTFDQGPGKLHWAITCTSQTADTVVGELWAAYSVVMQGTNPA